MLADHFCCFNSALKGVQGSGGIPFQLLSSANIIGTMFESALFDLLECGGPAPPATGGLQWRSSPL